MRYVSATDAKQRLAALLDAAQREPVMIRRQNRDVAVILSPQEYDRLRALNTDEFQRFCDRIGERAASRGMTEEKLAEILADESQGAVIDTNALVSRLLLPGSIPGQAVREAVAETQLLASDDTIIELADVLARKKFDPYTTVRERQEFLRLFDRIAERVPIVHVIRACREPTDDKFLELAVNGAAQLIITC